MPGRWRQARRRRGWSDLPPRQRAGASLGMAVQITLFTIAAIDLWRRPPERVRGSKWLWAPVLFLNGIGPLAYLLRGRR